MKWLKTAAVSALFTGCVALVLIGQAHEGPAWLGLMLPGLAGLLGLLYGYTRRCTRADRLQKRRLRAGERAQRREEEERKPL